MSSETRRAADMGDVIDYATGGRGYHFETVITDPETGKTYSGAGNTSEEAQQIASDKREADSTGWFW